MIAALARLGPRRLLAAGAPNTGLYDWSVTGPAADNCFLRVDARDYAGDIGSDVSDAGFTIASGALAVGPPADAAFALSPVAPDPARGLSRLTYTVPRRAHVRIALLDVQGRELALLAEGDREPGRYTASLDAAARSPGLYFIRMRAAGVALERRMVVLQ